MGDLQRLQGVWAAVSHIVSGEVRHAEADPPVTPAPCLVLDGHSYTVRKGDRVYVACDFSLDPGASPKHLDLLLRDGRGGYHPVPGIYRLDGDLLTICLSAERPRAFATESGVVSGLTVYRRMPVA